jgi:hypothetical protein
VETNVAVTVKDPTPVEVSCPVRANGSTLIVNEEVTLSVDAGVVKSWSSSDEKVATVGEDGTVKAVSAGTVTVTATDKVGKSSKVTLEVKDFSLNRDSVSLGVGDTYRLSANDGDSVESYKSSDAKVATVGSTGSIEGVSAGKATVTATDAFGNVLEVPVAVFDPSDYSSVEVTTDTDADGTETVRVAKGEATELQLTLSAKKATTASGVVFYMDGDTAVESVWVADFSKGTATVYVGDLPSDVEEVVFRVDYAGYWDGSKSQWVDSNSTDVPVSLDSAKGNVEAPSEGGDGEDGDGEADSTSVKPADVLALKRYLLGVQTPKDTSKLDYDGNGKVNLLDLLLAKRVLLSLAD